MRAGAEPAMGCALTMAKPRTTSTVAGPERWGKGFDAMVWTRSARTLRRDVNTIASRATRRPTTSDRRLEMTTRRRQRERRLARTMKQGRPTGESSWSTITIHCAALDEAQDGPLRFDGKEAGRICDNGTRIIAYRLREHPLLMIITQGLDTVPEDHVDRAEFTGSKPEALKQFDNDPRIERLLDEIGFTMTCEGVATVVDYLA